MSSQDELARAIAEAIEGYLAQHPDAGDSLEGIAGWWLSADLQGASPLCVQRALDSLVDAGVVKATELEAGVVIYSRSGPVRGNRH